MRRKTEAEGNKETNAVPQTQEEGRRRAKELAERAEEGGGGDKLEKEQQKANLRTAEEYRREGGRRETKMKLQNARTQPANGKLSKT